MFHLALLKLLVSKFKYVHRFTLKQSIHMYMYLLNYNSFILTLCEQQTHDLLFWNERKQTCINTTTNNISTHSRLRENSCITSAKNSNKYYTLLLFFSPFWLIYLTHNLHFKEMDWTWIVWELVSWWCCHPPQLFHCILV